PISTCFPERTAVILYSKSRKWIPPQGAVVPAPLSTIPAYYLLVTKGPFMLGLLALGLNLATILLVTVLGILLFAHKIPARPAWLGRSLLGIKKDFPTLADDLKKNPPKP